MPRMLFPESRPDQYGRGVSEGSRSLVARNGVFPLQLLVQCIELLISLLLSAVLSSLAGCLYFTLYGLTKLPSLFFLVQVI